MKNVLLINGGAKEPILSAMKYSTYYKSKGFNVGWNISDPNLVIGFILFEKDKWKAQSWKIQYPNVIFKIGGPGYDPSISLPGSVDKCIPDYSIYPDYKGSIGRVTIGCVRNCYFCKVPDMGKIRYVQPIWDFYRGGVCRILDDNILVMPGAWNETVRYCIEHGVKVSFENFDIRLINEKVAGQIADLKHEGHIKFSFDMISYGKELRKGVQYLFDAGIKKSKLMCYVYLHNQAHLTDAIKRWDILKDLDIDPFLMMNLDMIKPDARLRKRFKKIHRKGDRPAINRRMKGKEVFT